MQVVAKKLADLHKTSANIRRHSEKQIKEYMRSLEMFGQIRPMVVTEDGEILVGNGMYDALKAMGNEYADVYVVSGLSAAEKKKLMLADNKVYEMGFTDVSVLDSILMELDGDFDIPGYDAGLLEAILATPQEATVQVTEYGTAAPEVATTPVADAPQYQHETGQEQVYAPPVRSGNGAFVEPPAPPDDRGYIVCPHCGEKIWL